MIRLKVREVAEREGYKTPGALARESKVAYATVYRLWHKPEAKPENVTLGVLRRIAQVLSVKTAELYEDRAPVLVG